MMNIKKLAAAAVALALWLPLSVPYSSAYGYESTPVTAAKAAKPAKTATGCGSYPKGWKCR